MAAISNLDSNKKIVEIEEQIEGERVETNDYFFCKVGESIPLMSDNSTFDANDPPSQPLVFSQHYGLIFAAHSSGFCVAKVKDVIAAAKEIKDKGSGSSIQELSVIDVHIGRVSILALSMDSSYVSAVVGGDIQCFSVESLLNKDYKPSFCCSVESNHVKDMLWIKETESSFIVLTYNGTLHLGSLNKTLKHVMDGVDAVGRSVDGNQIAVGRKNNLSIFSSNFEKISQVLIPMDIWTGESDTIRVDGIRWVRSDSIVVGFFQQNEDDTEENYFIKVIMSKQGQIIDDSAKLTSVDFSDLFTGIVDDIVPAGCGPHLFVNYLENCGFAFVSNRKNIDQHIMLFNWAQKDNLVSVVDIERDSWLPRIELQESGDENLILGLCVDDSSVYENVKIKSGVEEEKELPPHCLLMCLTLEGKLIMFNVASITGTQRSTQALSSASSNALSISVVGHSDIGGADLRLEEESAKQSASDLKLHESEAKKTSSALDEVPLEKDQNQSEQSNYTLGTFKFDQNIRPELLAGNKNQQAVADVNNSKPFGRLGQSEEGRVSVAGDVFGTEKRNTEHGLSMTDKFLDNNLTSIGRGVEEKNKSGDLNSTPTTTTSGASLGSSGLSNARSLFTSPAFAKSTLSGSHLAPTDMASSSASIFGNLGSCSTVSSSSALGKALDYNQKPMTSSGLSGLPLSTPSSKVPLQESGKLQNFTGQSIQPILGNEKKSSPLNSEQNLSKQFSNVQNMANELDKLLQSIEEAGGFRDVCTAAHRSSLEALEEGMDSLSERNRVWQSCTEERLREIQLLLDKTVQVLARKTHMEGIVRQTTDGQYWDLWNRQKLNSELDQKRLNVYNRSQDLINRMIELEKHFNTLELNLYGESSGAHLVSRALNSRSAPSRHNQSLHAVHNATISQLAAAKQLSDSLSKQMTVLSIKSPPTKRASVKKQVFESIGIPYPDDSLCSPNTVKVMESPSNRRPSVSHSGEARTDSKRINLSGVSSHDLETARRRRDSLDRNWANFEAPKTTVKRMVVQNERQNAGSLFSSMDKHLVSPGRLERPISNQSKVLAAQDRNGRMDMPQKLNSDTTATSKYKWAGGIPELPQTVTEQPPRWQILQGDSFPVTQNRSSSSSSSSLSTTFVDPNIKKGNILSAAERPGSQVGNIDKSNRSGTASTETKPFVLQFAEQKSTIQKIQPQIFSFPFGGQAPISDNKETELTKSAVGQRFSEASTSKQSVEASPLSVFPPFSSSSSPNLSWQTLPITSGDSGSTTSTQIAKDVNKEVLQVPSSAISVPSSSAEPMSSLTSTESKEVLQFPTSAISVSAPQAAPVISPSSKGTASVDSDSTKSSVNSAKEPLKISPEATANKESSGDKLVVTQSAENLASSSSDGLNFAHLVPPASSVEVPKAFASSPDINKSATHVNGIVSNTPEKQLAPITSSLAFPSELGGATGGKSNIETTLTQEDEMEEEAPETNQTAQTSLGSFAGFGIGSTPPSATAPKNNPFGGPIASAPQTMPTSNSLAVPSGELFRPASFSFQSLQASQPSQPANIGAPNAFGFANSPQISSGSGFGQPSQIGSGQQALGSVLGSFGQSRQLGSGLPGSGFGVPQSPGGGFVNAPTGGFGGGFATAAAGGGFAAAATGGSGFAAAAPSGGFAAAAPSGGGFAAAAPSVGGFASAGGGAGGFGAFGNTGTSGFAGFSGGAGGRQAPSELFTQMRK